MRAYDEEMMTCKLSCKCEGISPEDIATAKYWFEAIAILSGWRTYDFNIASDTHVTTEKSA